MKKYMMDRVMHSCGKIFLKTYFNEDFEKTGAKEPLFGQRIAGEKYIAE
jgi:hypothetical protein